MSATTAHPAAPTVPDGLGQNAAPLKAGQSVETIVAARPHVAEPKFDGWRLHVHVAADGVHLYTRNAKEHTGSLPAHEAELSKLPAGTWLDAEAVAFEVVDGRVEHKWGVVQSVLGSGTTKAAKASESITLMVFDLISHGGIDARSLPYEKRRALLESMFANHDFTWLRLSPQVAPTEKSLDALLAQGFEGMMLKALDAPYASGKRGHGWTKVKPQTTDEGIVMGYKEGENGFAGLVGALIIGQYDHGDLIEVTRCSGMSMAERHQISAHRDDYLGRVVEFKHMGQMDTGGYRHPQFKRWRPDKPAKDCVVSDA